MHFICPKCNKPLAVYDDSYARCPSGHSYDKAREGYFNLLLSADGGVHGDNAEMVSARRAFLDTGAYYPLAERLSELVGKYLSGRLIADLGCGEGYYTDIMEKTLRHRDVTVMGFDISKDAVRRAARRNPRLDLAVASAYRMPISDGSVDLAVNVFSPLAIDETRRIIRTGGIFAMVIPGADHLFGLKAATYEHPYKNEVKNTFLRGFSLLESSYLSYPLELRSNAEVRSLFMMTPYAYRTPREDRERVLALDFLKTDAEFWIFLYKKEQ